MDSVQEETLAVLATVIIVDNKHNRPLLLQRRRHRLTEEDLRRALAPGEEVLLEGKVRKRANVRNCTNLWCNCWHPPVCQNDMSESGCKFGDNCLFRHTEADRQPSKKVDRTVV